MRCILITICVPFVVYQRDSVVEWSKKSNSLSLNSAQGSYTVFHSLLTRLAVFPTEGRWFSSGIPASFTYKNWPPRNGAVVFKVAIKTNQSDHQLLSVANHLLTFKSPLWNFLMNSRKKLILQHLDTCMVGIINYVWLFHQPVLLNIRFTKKH